MSNLEYIQPGDTIYTSLVKCNRAGDSRQIKVFIIRSDPYSKTKRVSSAFRPFDITYDVAMACGFKMTKDRNALVVHGGGMDMGFHIVYSLGRTLFPEGFTCMGEGCISNDHFNGDKDYTPHNHTDGGYALIHRWL